MVVPVHDEEERLARCLAAVHRSVAALELDGLRTTVVVALDACRDGSDAIARRAARPTDVVVAVDERNVGATRAAGTRAGLDALGLPPESVWLAHTDADTSVPPRWLARQLALAARADAVAGVVRVDDWAAHHPATRRRYERGYRAPWFGAHRHVHGANLGVRASSYLDVGGFPPLACSEDHALWDALRTGGHRVVSTRQVWVTTSGRRDGRARGGFADTLLQIEQVARAATPGARPSRRLLA